MATPENENQDGLKKQLEVAMPLIENKIPELLPENENEKDGEDVDSQTSFSKKEKEQMIYQNVLEKLELTQKDQGFPEKSMQQEHQPKGNDLSPEVKTIIENDFQKIDLMMRLGLINPLQGQNLKNNVLKKAFDMSIQKDCFPQGTTVASKPINKDELFDEFSKTNPNFFDSDGRKDVLNYLKSDDVLIRKEDLTQISKMIEVIEQSAIDRYLQKKAHEGVLNNSNEAAKQKLRANAQNQSYSNNIPRTFTREQIGKMSSAEFSKNESFIMEQLRKGLIR